MKPAEAKNRVAAPRLAFFERYLSLWVALCMLAGVVLGKMFRRRRSECTGHSKIRLG